MIESIYSIAADALKVGAPGLSESIRNGIARNIATRVSALRSSELRSIASRAMTEEEVAASLSQKGPA